MKLKLMEVIKKLPDTNYNVTKAAKEVGYSKSYAETLIHKRIRKYIGVKSDDDIRDEFIRQLDRDINRFRKEQDNTNYLRAKELKARILQFYKEQSTQNIAVFKDIEKELNKLDNKDQTIQPVVVSDVNNK